MILELFPTDWRALWGSLDTAEPVGAIFTKPEIVELILDLAGYDPEKERLAARPLLEPSCGDGAFLALVVRRLLDSERHHLGSVDWNDVTLDGAIRAADISTQSVSSARALVSALLESAGCETVRAHKLAETWIVQTDFLLGTWPTAFEFVVGNPPYVRIEDVPKQVLSRYRELFVTSTDRADLYVAFIEKGLELLSTTGTLAFICANRFAKNKYGGALRQLIADRYHVRHYVNLEHTQPFVSDVSAYPAILVVDRVRGETTRAGTLDDIEEHTLSAVRAQALGHDRSSGPIREFREWYPSGTPWMTTCDAEHAMLTALNESLPTLEESGGTTKVGIGVATGSDAVFVLDGKRTDIEESRQIPLLLAANVTNAELKWSGRYLLNPFEDESDGGLVDLSDYPRMAAYLEKHDALLRKRHVARSRPNAWYRTIDRIWPALQHQEKLVIPDIQSTSLIGFDDGQFYPHHNLYWITSDTWPLLALKALLRSSLVYNQVRAYSVQMRGGSLRYQAQTLRRVRIPFIANIPDMLIEKLVDVAQTDRQREIDELAVEAFSFR
jgi:hypothetical protein